MSRDEIVRGGGPKRPEVVHLVQFSTGGASAEVALRVYAKAPPSGEEDAEMAWIELREAGAIDPDAPSPFEHERWRSQLGRDFTPAERAEIRVHLGLGQ